MNYKMYMILAGSGNAYSTMLINVELFNTVTNKYHINGVKSDNTIGDLIFHYDSGKLIVDSSDCVYGIRQVFGVVS